MTLKELLNQLIEKATPDNLNSEVMICSIDKNNHWVPATFISNVSISDLHENKILIRGKYIEFENKLDDTG